MKLEVLLAWSEIQEGLRSLTEEFISEYPYYAEWIKKNEDTFRNGNRLVVAMRDEEKKVGYMMLHFSSKTCAKINGIYVFPECQKKGYAKQALKQILENLKYIGYEYAFIQTRLHNEIVVHMFETLNFNVIGKNYHNIEKKYNWVACFDLQGKADEQEMKALAEKLYPGFETI